jgi:hypothetical protein
MKITKTAIYPGLGADLGALRASAHRTWELPGAFVYSEDNRTAQRVRECDYFFRNRIARVLAKALSAMPAVSSFTITRR